MPDQQHDEPRKANQCTQGGQHGGDWEVISKETRDRTHNERRYTSDLDPAGALLQIEELRGASCGRQRVGSVWLAHPAVSCDTTDVFQSII